MRGEKLLEKASKAHRNSVDISLQALFVLSIVAMHREIRNNVHDHARSLARGSYVVSL